MNIKVMIAMHKPYMVPKEDMYLPVHVGCVGKNTINLTEYGVANVTRDDEGDNISYKNPYFCELTAMYYGWKNIEADAIGLVHYRRYFKGFDGSDNKWEKLLTKIEAEYLLENVDMIVPNPRNYYIESLYSHYAHTLDGRHLDVAKDVIKDLKPEYLKYVDQVYESKKGYMFNMFVMKKPLFDQYCQWLFDILFEMEKRIDTKDMDAFSARLFGRVSEILFNVWLQKKIDEKSVSFAEVKVMDMENVNWLKKGGSFLAAKFLGKKYKKSF